jgi:hypothetical protein
MHYVDLTASGQNRAKAQLIEHVQINKQIEKERVESQGWYHMPAIPALGRLRQEDPKFDASLGYTAKLCFKKKREGREDIPVQWDNSKWSNICVIVVSERGENVTKDI